MLLRGVPEPVDPQERAVYRNLRVLVEAATVQQAESSTSRLRPASSLATGGTGTRQTDRSIRSPLQPSGAARGAATTPRSEPALTPHRPPVHERPDPHQDARSIISNRHRARHDDDVHRVVTEAGDTDPGQTIEGSGETRLRRGRRPDDRSPSPEGPGPRAFSRRIRRAPFPQRFRPPTNIAKYTRETNPGIWLKDF